MEINWDEFQKPEGMEPYSKEALEEGKKYYRRLKFYSDGRVMVCDWDGNEIEEWVDPK